MSTADVVLAYIKTLVWPAIVALALILFRDPIRGLLGGLEEFEGFGFKAKIRRQVTEAATGAKAALAGSPIEQLAAVRASQEVNAVEADDMKEALKLSSNLVHEPDASVTSQIQRMRLVVDQLNTAIIAVLAVIMVSQSTEGGPQPRPNMTAAGIEGYMAAHTGWAGWRGAIEARDILRGSVAMLCGKRGEAVEPAQVILFVTAGEDALQRWSTLINNTVASAPSYQSRD
jgi:hypothetical protein